MSDKRILLVESDPAALAFLSNTLTGAGYTVLSAPSGKEGLIEAWRQRPELMIIVAELPDVSGLDIVKKLRADPRTAHSKMLLLSRRNFPQDIQAGMQAGADEYIIKRPGADAELLERVRALLPSAGPAAGSGSPATGPLPGNAGPANLGRLISFLSAKGGTGTSSLCVNLAQMMAERARDKQVAVVDLVLPIGSLHYIVGVDTPERNIVAATKLELRHITGEKLRTLMTRREEWRFHLLPGAPDPDTAQELKVERLEQVIDGLRRSFDFVFIDFGRALSRISLPFIRHSSKVMVVTSPDAATVALTKTIIHFFDAHDVRRHKIFLLLNRAVGLEGLNRPEMERELGFSIPTLVPHMSGQFAMANNLHQPIALKFPNDTVTFTLQNMAISLLEQFAQMPLETGPLPAL
jgi:DNA-binding response OmpR family regulator